MGHIDPSTKKGEMKFLFSTHNADLLLESLKGIKFGWLARGGDIRLQNLY
jgi:hypothetical protein